MSRTVTVVALGSTQTLAWASSYYIPAILAAPMARDLGLSTAWVFGAVSAALLLTAVLGPAVGRAIDVRGGRDVLVGSNLVLALGLVVLALAQGPVALAFGWLVLGVGMAAGLYDAAFATLAGLYGRAARSPITGITLIAGFASTVGWPLSAVLEAELGWRAACLVWAGLHLVLGLPVNRFLIPKAPPPAPAAAEVGEEAPAPRFAMPLLAFTFAAAWFVTGAMAVHLPRLIEAAGASAATAIAAGTLVGPAQVAARIAEFGLLRRAHPLISARLATSLHPVGAILLVTLGGGPLGAAAFALLHGAGNGLLTIARGTLPLAIFGPVGFGHRTGWIGAPARATQAISPFLFSMVLDGAGPWLALLLSSTMILAAFSGLMLLRPDPPAEPVPTPERA
jgi:predicted MFS family arabinose efflux permease